MYAELIEKIKEKTIEAEGIATQYMEPGTKLIRPPATSASVAETEKLLGFELDPLLREIYLKVGNGRVGPCCNIPSLQDGVGKYDESLSDAT